MRSLLARLRAGRLLLATGLVAVLIPVAIALAVGNESGFEDDDGNLAPNPLGLNFDWNSFAPTTWTGTAPNRTSSKTVSGWVFTGLEDAQATGTDNAFAGGTKQDADCASVGTQKASNKDDLKRVYFASNTVNGHVYLNLAWVRIPQQTTSSSAHVAFEFNQGSTPCPAGSDSLVRRSTANGGDMLLVYDFEGGAATPTIRLSRWIASGTCEVGSNSPPCWSAAQTLGTGVAEAAVNTGTTVTDTIAPVPPESLADSEFGEAGIDLTDAGVFPAGQCVHFGQGFAVSRSSGNSSQAQMKDLVGPGQVNIRNCGKIIIHKVTENGDATFGYTTTGGLNPATFELSNGQSRTYSDATQVQPGNYSVTESTIPADWTLKSLVCTATGSGTSVTPSGATATIVMAPDGVVDCTYTNHTKLKPTISTTLSDTTIEVGGTVHDSATLAGATANAGGTVTYTVYSDSACTQGARDAGTKTVTNGVVPDSDPITFHSAGDFFWQAVYSGDADNEAATSDCTSEHLVVNKKQPSISTTLSASTIEVGESVHDSATLAGTTADAGGTVSYTYYTDSACTQNAVNVSTVTVTNGVVPDSDSVTFNSAGDFFWQATYSGDANNKPAISDCTSEHLVVTKKHPAMSTAQNLLPNDDATISGATSNAGGTITFDLFSPSDATCAGTPALTQTVSVNGNGTYSTTNTTFLATDEGTWRWQVSYSGDANNDPTTSACGVERFTIDNHAS